ncbi:MAG: hypothetical protein ABIP49_10240 [Lysobacterales bacterium]
MLARLSSALAALLVVAAPIHAGSLVDLTVVDPGGNAFAQTLFRGDTYVAGNPGARYTLRVANRSGERVLVVLSVDGVNVISGQTASPSQQGYVLAPWQQVDIRGWRKNLEETAEFYFTELPDSYAARTGRPLDVGVIGAAVFREVPPPPPVLASPPVAYEHGSYSEREDATRQNASAKSARAERRQTPMAAQESQAADAVAAAPLGTGHGERRYDPASTTEFKRARNRPDEIVRVFYDRHESLVARGIWPTPPTPYYERSPRAFPATFAPDPW